MNAKTKNKTQGLSEEEIDRVVEAEADDDDAWEDPIQVRKASPASFTLPSELARRADFLARLHRADGTEGWLAQVIRERIELEELAFSRAKRELAAAGERRMKKPVRRYAAL